MVVSAPDHGDDGALVEAVQGGDVDAFAALFRRHYPAVRRACARRLGDAGEADELAQAAFVRAFERIGQCAGDRRFGPWVHVIARSLCMDTFRSRARVEPCEQPLAGRHEHRSNEPEDSVLDRELAAQVQEALATLPDRQRRAVIARDWEGLRPGEIADRLGLSVGAVDSLLLRARRRLALSYRRLAGEGGRVTGTLPLRSAVTAVGATLIFAPGAVMAGTAAAASAVQDTAGRAAEGVVAAAVSVAVSLGVAAPPADAPPPPPPAAVVTVVTVPGEQPAVARRTPAPLPQAERAPAPPGEETAPGPVTVATVPPAVPVALAPLPDPTEQAETEAEPPKNQVEATEEDEAAADPPVAEEAEPVTPDGVTPDRGPPPPGAPEPAAAEESADQDSPPAPPPPAPSVGVDIPPAPSLPGVPLAAVRLGSGPG